VIGGLLLILVVLAVAVLAVSTGISVVRRQRRSAARRAAFAGTVAAIYAVALFAVSLASKPRTLADGDWKCFDDWCVTLVSAAPASFAGTGQHLVIQVHNKGRRAQRPDAPRAFIVKTGHRIPVTVPNLTARVDGGSTVTLPVTVPLSGPAASAQLLITEGGFPSRLTIGDENSPWHAKQSWQL
jgi:hypothetical protein